jgi:hypothetical protein
MHEKRCDDGESGEDVDAEVAVNDFYDEAVKEGNHAEDDAGEERDGPVIVMEEA